MTDQPNNPPAAGFQIETVHDSDLGPAGTVLPTGGLDADGHWDSSFATPPADGHVHFVEGEDEQTTAIREMINVNRQLAGIDAPDSPRRVILRPPSEGEPVLSVVMQQFVDSNPLKSERWYISCGCGGHGDHLACVQACIAVGGCHHVLGVDYSAPSEADADAHEHDMRCAITQAPDAREWLSERRTLTVAEARTVTKNEASAPLPAGEQPSVRTVVIEDGVDSDLDLQVKILDARTIDSAFDDPIVHLSFVTGEHPSRIAVSASMLRRAVAEVDHLIHWGPPAAPHCPTCDSYDPKKHPAVQHEGEVNLCPDPWHSPTADQIRASWTEPTGPGPQFDPPGEPVAAYRTAYLAKARDLGLHVGAMHPTHDQLSECITAGLAAAAGTPLYADDPAAPDRAGLITDYGDRLTLAWIDGIKAPYVRVTPEVIEGFIETTNEGRARLRVARQMLTEHGLTAPEPELTRDAAIPTIIEDLAAEVARLRRAQNEDRATIADQARRISDYDATVTRLRAWSDRLAARVPGVYMLTVKSEDGGVEPVIDRWISDLETVAGPFLVELCEAADLPGGTGDFGDLVVPLPADPAEHEHLFDAAVRLGGEE